MMLGYKKLGGVVLGAAALLALLPAAASAQFVRYSPIFWSFDGRGGVAVPAGDLKDISDAGATVGAGLAYFLNPRFALRLDGNIDFLKEKQVGAPDIVAWHYTGGFEIHVTNPSSRGMVTIGVAAGGVTFDTDEFTVEDFNGETNLPAQGYTTRTAFEDTNFALDGGVRLGVNAGDVVTIFVGGKIRILFMDEEQTAALAHKLGVQPISSGVLIPIEGGIRINVP